MVSPKKTPSSHGQGRSLDEISAAAALSTDPLKRDPFSITAARSRSLSPHKKLPRQPVHIRVNLTESQVNRITDAFVLLSSYCGTWSS
jgi:hypothetical protein